MAEYSSINALKTQITKRQGLAKPSRFVVEFGLPSGVGSIEDRADLSIMCQSVILPTRQITTYDYPGTQRQSFRVPSGYTNDQVACKFLLGADFFPKDIFDAWLSASVDPISYRVKYIDQYSATVNIYQLDEFNNRVYGVQLDHAFPTSVSPIQMDAGSTDQVHTMDVTFSYYDVLYLSGSGAPMLGPSESADRAENPIPKLIPAR